MLGDFLVRAALAGVGVSLVSGPLGSLLLWRRMAYFSDAAAHGAVLGVALALALSLPLALGVFVSALLLGVLVSVLGRRGQGQDTALIVIAYSALAAGLVGVSLAGQGGLSLEALLFGDILATGRGDLVLIYGGAIGALGLLAWRWRGLLTATLSEDLARAAGIDPDRERLALTVALAIVIAIALKVIGALLIGALLIIPAAAARSLARSPESMAVIASGFGALACFAGLGGSLYWDTPAGPSIVVAASALFVAALAFRRR